MSQFAVIARTAQLTDIRKFQTLLEAPGGCEGASSPLHRALLTLVTARLHREGALRALRLRPSKLPRLTTCSTRRFLVGGGG